MSSQTYEDYWSITNAFTNYNSEKFIKTLKICIDFIEGNKNTWYSEDKYRKLQILVNFDWLNDISIRKRINQLVKLGFIEPFLRDYNNESLLYLEAKTNRKRQSLLSKIVYSSSKLNSSVNEDSDEHQINFLLKTLEEVWKLTKWDIIALMIVDINKYKDKWYINETELNFYKNIAINDNFIERKYNQVWHFLNLLKKLDDIVFVNNEMYFEEDAKIIFWNELKIDIRKRDNYLHRIYKNQLKEEVEEKYNLTICMVERLDYPSLVASHIKPFIISEEDEAYDPNNWLLLSRNIDILFDQGYISFSNEWKIIYWERLSNNVKFFLQDYTLDSYFLNEKRSEYLKFHRDNVLK